jgi:hypothetical protein
MPEAAASPGAPAVARADPSAGDLPTQEGPKGLRYDFNDGCRVVVPESDHPWRVRLSDLDTGNVLSSVRGRSRPIRSRRRSETFQDLRAAPITCHRPPAHLLSSEYNYR